jgi:hypothetical protein
MEAAGKDKRVEEAQRTCWERKSKQSKLNRRLQKDGLVYLRNGNEEDLIDVMKA